MKIDIFDTAIKVSMALAKTSSISSRVSDDLGQHSGAEAEEQHCSNKNRPKVCTDFGENSEYADLAEKVFEDLNAALDRDELIDEFDIIPVESKANHSPVLHVVGEHKLALEAWCVPYLFTHSYKSFLAIRRKQKCSSSTSLTTTLSRYGSFKASNLSESDRISRGLALSRTVVLLNPDITVAWNFRRDFVPIASEMILESELRLVSLVATRKPKCPEGFAYRRWLMSQGIENHLLVPDTTGEWFSLEAKSIEVPILRYFSNYHAWNYKIWLLQKILYNEEIQREQKQQILTDELKFSDSWMNTQVSDYCGHYYKQKLLQLLMAENGLIGTESLITRMNKELDENAQRIELYEGHESLWCHRRIIMKMLLEYFANSFTTLTEILDKEKQFVTLIFKERTETSKECTALNFNLCKNYVMWTNAQFARFNWQLPTNNFNISQKRF